MYNCEINVFEKYKLLFFKLWEQRRGKSLVLFLQSQGPGLFYFILFYTMASGNQDAESRHYTTVQGATRNAVARYVVWKMLKTLFIKMRVMNLAELLL